MAKVSTVPAAREGSKDVVLLAIVFLVGAAAYLNTLDGGFVYDDGVAVTGNGDVRGDSSIAQLFSNDYWGNLLSHSHTKSYRPVTVLSFRLTHSLVGMNAQAFHLGNILLHSAACSLIFVLFKQLLSTSSVAFASALLFALHPVHTEAVANICGRAEMLSTIFYVGSILSFLKSVGFSASTAKPRPTQFAWSWTFLAILSAIMALLCKEPGITALLVIVSLDVVFVCEVPVNLRVILAASSQPWFKLLVRRAIFYLVSFAIIFGVRLSMNGIAPLEFSPADNPASFDSNFSTRILTYLYLYTVNARVLLYPQVLLADYAHGTIPLVTSLSDERNLASAGLLGALILWVVLSTNLLSNIWPAHEKDTESSVQSPPKKPNMKQAHIPALGPFAKLMAASFILLAVPFLPASNLFTRVGFVVAERVLYIPSIGFILAIAAIIEKTKSFLETKSPALSHAVWGLTLALMAYYALRTYNRNFEWHDDESLWRATVRDAPQSAKNWKSLGLTLRESNRFTEAEPYFLKCIEIDPELGDCYLELGLVHHNLGHVDQAYAYYHKVFEVPKHYYPTEDAQLYRSMVHTSVAQAYSNLGILMANNDRLQEAEKFFREAYRHNPKRGDYAYNNLAYFLRSTGREHEINRL